MNVPQLEIQDSISQYLAHHPVAPASSSSAIL
jgi:hypothetical protein